MNLKYLLIINDFLKINFIFLKTYSERAVESVKKHLSKYNPNNQKNTLPSNLFEPYKKEISDLLRGKTFDKFMESEKYTRFCQRKNYELNMQVFIFDKNKNINFSTHKNKNDLSLLSISTHLLKPHTKKLKSNLSTKR